MLEISCIATPGTLIKTALEECITIADRLGISITLEFNGEKIQSINRFSRLEELLKEYNEGFGRQR